VLIVGGRLWDRSIYCLLVSLIGLDKGGGRWGIDMRSEGLEEYIIKGMNRTL
jgi:hypothetical protein